MTSKDSSKKPKPIQINDNPPYRGYSTNAAQNRGAVVKKVSIKEE